MSPFQNVAGQNCDQALLSVKTIHRVLGDKLFRPTGHLQMENGGTYESYALKRTMYYHRRVCDVIFEVNAIPRI